MKAIIIAVKDLSIPAFMSPGPARAAGQAIRSFIDETNRKEQTNNLYMHPADFELWQLAEFDEETGQFENTPKILMRGIDAKQAE